MTQARMVIAVALGLLSLGGYAAETAVSTDGGQQAGPGGRKPPSSPIVTALDANGDGVIDAGEIANAAAALKKLDKNGDGKLTRDEYMPARPHGKGGAGGAKPPDER